MDENHKISFPSSPDALGLHDRQVVDVLKRCLVRNRADRASIKELQQHPYTKKPELTQFKLLEELRLTPNTQNKVRKALEEKNNN